LCALIALTMSGCATVHPYQRGELMTRVMVPAPDALESSFDVHVYRTREGMAGAELGAGVSCGCN